MKIVIVYNLVPDDNYDPENIVIEDSLHTVNSISKSLKSLGHDVRLFNLTSSSASKLGTQSPDIFFNQAWGIGNDQDSEDQVALLLEKTERPYTGPNAKSIGLSSYKSQTKELLMRKNIPTPKFQRIKKKSTSVAKNLNLPIIVKPDGQDCSLGIDQQSVFFSKEGIVTRVNYLLDHFHQPAILEEFIEGRELNVTILGNGQKAEVLPVSEIVFGKSFKKKFKIVDFAAKWEKRTAAYRDTLGVCPAKLTAEQCSLVNQIALKTFLTMECRDYARVDIRLSKENIPYVLEVNNNPAIGPSDGVARSARAAGYSYPALLEEILNSCLNRHNHSSVLSR